MLPDDLAHVDRLARRVDGPGPVVVIDPAAGNLLTANHAAGLAPAPGQASWWSTPNVTTTSTPYAPVLASLQAPDDLTTLVWYAPTPTQAYPVVPGRQVTWWAPSLAGVAQELRMWCYGADGAYVTWFFSAYTDRPLVVTVPDNVAYVRVGVKLHRSFTALPVGPSLLALTTPEHAALRVGNRQAFSAAQQAGKVPLTQYAVTGTGGALSDVGGLAHVTMPNGGLIYWVPTAGAHGFPITPGQLAVFAAQFSKSTSLGVDFRNSTGEVVASVGRQAAAAPPGAAYARPWVSVSSTTAATPIGSASLMVWDQAPPLPAGEGAPLLSITGYGQSIQPGQLAARDVTLELVEVISATG
ncbi:hypothetical protein [Streptomyces olivoreticuli]|uniref:hypothetical protein n=1 Tax=Streptomyces olivoreticuli TaxID=68246 RepID=UPI0013C309E3|nr:hypothetical protein [Streptomyces olivoreticuli]